MINIERCFTSTSKTYNQPAAWSWSCPLPDCCSLCRCSDPRPGDTHCWCWSPRTRVCCMVSPWHSSPLAHHCVTRQCWEESLLPGDWSWSQHCHRPWQTLDQSASMMEPHDCNMMNHDNIISNWFSYLPVLNAALCDWCQVYGWFDLQDDRILLLSLVVPGCDEVETWVITWHVPQCCPPRVSGYTCKLNKTLVHTLLKIF